jgi:hypothetical protein
MTVKGSNHLSDFLSEKRKEIQQRLKELRPLIDEYHRLEAAERALAGVEGEVAAAPAAASGGGRRRRGAAASSGGGTGARRGRPKGTGTRAVQALELVRARPGITIPELAEAMGIKQNYLYRVMPSLADEGQVIKSGRGWHTRGRPDAEPVVSSVDDDGGDEE